jgi:multicomponent Na+:H+ antiporter subunit E
MRRVIKALGLCLLFAKELLLSNIRVAKDVLSPRPRIRPVVIAVPLSLKSDLGITLLGNLITLTPGTISLDVSPDRAWLFVHSLYLDNDDQEAFVASIKNGFERLVAEVCEGEVTP